MENGCNDVVVFVRGLIELEPALRVEARGSGCVFDRGAGCCAHDIGDLFGCGSSSDGFFAIKVEDSLDAHKSYGYGMRKANLGFCAFEYGYARVREGFRGADQAYWDNGPFAEDDEGLVMGLSLTGRAVDVALCFRRELGTCLLFPYRGVEGEARPLGIVKAVLKSFLFVGEKVGILVLDHIQPDIGIMSRMRHLEDIERD